MSGFAHNFASGTTTLSEIARVRVAISANKFFGCFAYGHRLANVKKMTGGRRFGELI